MSTRRFNTVLIKSVAQRLKEVRKERGISQINAYIDTDIHVARAETGTKNISISTIGDLCNYYEITLEEFFKDIKSK